MMSNICAIGAIKVFSELNGEIKRNDLVKGLFLINEEVKTFGKRKISNIQIQCGHLFITSNISNNTKVGVLIGFQKNKKFMASEVLVDDSGEICSVICLIASDCETNEIISNIGKHFFTQ